MSRVRSRAADVVGRGAGALSRALGRGSGGTVRGRITMALAPDALREVAEGRRTMLVSATNGKTTTTAMIVAALGGQTATNISGANMPFGILPYLLDSQASRAVLEVDELYLPAVGSSVSPELLVLLNLSRDSLDRSAEVSAVAARWRHFLEAHPVRCVANAADPHVVHAVGECDAVWVDPGRSPWLADSLVCPRCARLIDWSSTSWRCRCGLAQPDAAYRVRGTTIAVPSGTVEALLALPGAMNVGNAAFAVAAAAEWGVSADDAASRLASLRTVDGRFSTIRLGSRSARLILAKNPGGWASTLPLVPEGGPVMVGLNARDVDGIDTSWIWDVPFERFVGQVVGATGEHRFDLAARLDCAGARVVVDADPDRLAEHLPAGDLIVVANYTAFRWLERRG